jgi:hypothetical protein
MEYGGSFGEGGRKKSEGVRKGWRIWILLIRDHRKTDMTNIKDFNYFIELYKEQLEKGDIHVAYIGLIKYVTRLGATLSNVILRPIPYSRDDKNLSFSEKKSYALIFIFKSD